MYDVIIIGCGAAGLTAAIYAARYNLKTLVIFKEFGGSIIGASIIENFPGFKEISGIELMKRMKEQARNLGVDFQEGDVIDIKNKFTVIIKGNKKFKSKTLILALGTRRKKLNLSNEDRYIGLGISYCATCDAPFYKNKTVAVVGAGNSGALAVILLKDYAKKIYWLSRSNTFKAEPIRVEQIKKLKNVETIKNVNIKKIKGEKILTSIDLDNGKNLKIDGLFVEIGSFPSTNLARLLDIKLDKDKYIITNNKQETNIEGIFAAGDVTNFFLKQLTTACSQGAVAATSAYRYLNNK
jgi:thioredoxin reductase (NADPH)